MLRVRTSKQKGFTIIELLIAIVVIAILATISAVAYSGIQARSRDGIRKSDLAEIKKALILYNLEQKNWIETGSGCGYGGNGSGWFNYVGSPSGDYTASIASCLTDAGYSKEGDFIDPTGGVTSTPSTGYTYMKYHCGSGDAQRVYVYAKLETVPQSSTATDGTCSSSLDTSYGMNYYVQVR